MHPAIPFISSHPEWAFLRVRSRSKIPVVKGWQKNVPDPKNSSRVMTHVANGGNYGIVCGEASGIFVVDYDKYKSGITFDTDTFVLVNPDGTVNTRLADTLTVASPRGGIHQYFLLPEELKTTKAIHNAVDQIDVQINNVQILGPGSKTEDGMYRIVKDCDIIDPPQDILDYISEHTILRTSTAPLVGRGTIERTVQCPEGRSSLEEYIQELLDDRDAGVTLGRELEHLGEGVFSCSNNYLPRTCIISGECHDSNNAYVTCHNGTVRFHCLAAACRGQSEILGDLTLKDMFMEVIPLHERGRPVDQPYYPWELKFIKEHENTMVKYTLTELGSKMLYNGNEWFVYDTHRWKNVPECNEPFVMIHECLEQYIKKLEAVGVACLTKMNEMGDKENSKQVQGWLQKLEDKRIKMTTQTHIEAIMKRARSHYRSSRLMDDRRNLLGFEDGVLDLDTMEFREGLPSDYLSFSTGWNYADPPDDHMLAQLRRFLSSVWENEVIETYVVKSLATCLHGGKNRMFFLASGVGGNGKTKLVEAMAKAMGEYATTINAVYFTTKDAGTGASPHVMDLHGRRLVAFEEPDSGSQLQVDKIKFLTGDDYAKSRGLYQSMQTISLQAHLWMSCNHQPRLDMDGGMERRTVFLDFPMQFKPPDDLDPSKPNHRSADFDLVKDMASDAMGWTLLWYLLQQVKDGIPDSLPLPPELKDHSKNQRDLQDPTAVFVGETLENDKDSSIKSIDVYNMYLAWARNNPQWSVDNSRFPLSQTAFSMELKRLLGIKPARRKYGMVWMDYKVKSVDPESLFEEG